MSSPRRHRPVVGPSLFPPHSTSQRFGYTSPHPPSAIDGLTTLTARPVIDPFKAFSERDFHDFVGNVTGRIRAALSGQDWEQQQDERLKVTEGKQVERSSVRFLNSEQDEKYDTEEEQSQGESELNVGSSESPPPKLNPSPAKLKRQEGGSYSRDGTMLFRPGSETAEDVSERELSPDRSHSNESTPRQLDTLNKSDGVEEQSGYEDELEEDAEGEVDVEIQSQQPIEIESSDEDEDQVEDDNDLFDGEDEDDIREVQQRRSESRSEIDHDDSQIRDDQDDPESYLDPVLADPGMTQDNWAQGLSVSREGKWNTFLETVERDTTSTDWQTSNHQGIGPSTQSAFQPPSYSQFTPSTSGQFGDFESTSQETLGQKELESFLGKWAESIASQPQMTQSDSIFLPMDSQPSMSILPLNIPSTEPTAGVANDTGVTLPELMEIDEANFDTLNEQQPLHSNPFSHLSPLTAKQPLATSMTHLTSPLISPANAGMWGEFEDSDHGQIEEVVDYPSLDRQSTASVLEVETSKGEASREYDESVIDVDRRELTIMDDDVEANVIQDEDDEIEFQGINVIPRGDEEEEIHVLPSSPVIGDEQEELNQEISEAINKEPRNLGNGGADSPGSSEPFAYLEGDWNQDDDPGSNAQTDDRDDESKVANDDHEQDRSIGLEDVLTPEVLQSNDTIHTRLQGVVAPGVWNSETPLLFDNDPLLNSVSLTPKAPSAQAVTFAEAPHVGRHDDSFSHREPSLEASEMSDRLTSRGPTSFAASSAPSSFVASPSSSPPASVAAPPPLQSAAMGAPRAAVGLSRNNQSRASSIDSSAYAEPPSPSLSARQSSGTTVTKEQINVPGLPHISEDLEGTPTTASMGLPDPTKAPPPAIMLPPNLEDFNANGQQAASQASSIEAQPPSPPRSTGIPDDGSLMVDALTQELGSPVVDLPDPMAVPAPNTYNVVALEDIPSNALQSRSNASSEMAQPPSPIESITSDLFEGGEVNEPGLVHEPIVEEEAVNQLPDPRDSPPPSFLPAFKASSFPIRQDTATSSVAVQPPSPKLAPTSSVMGDQVDSRPFVNRQDSFNISSLVPNESRGSESRLRNEILNEQDQIVGSSTEMDRLLSIQSAESSDLVNELMRFVDQGEEVVDQVDVEMDNVERSIVTEEAEEEEEDSVNLLRTPSSALAEAKTSARKRRHANSKDSTFRPDQSQDSDDVDSDNTTGKRTPKRRRGPDSKSSDTPRKSSSTKKQSRKSCINDDAVGSVAARLAAELDNRPSTSIKARFHSHVFTKSPRPPSSQVSTTSNDKVDQGNFTRSRRGSPAISTTPAVTRSNCHYIKLRFPVHGDNDGEGYIFLVPQCSTAGKESQMQELGIENCGEASHIDQSKSIKLEHDGKSESQGDNEVTVVVDEETMDDLVELVGYPILKEGQIEVLPSNRRRRDSQTTPKAKQDDIELNDDPSPASNTTTTTKLYPSVVIPSATTNAYKPKGKGDNVEEEVKDDEVDNRGSTRGEKRKRRAHSKSKLTSEEVASSDASFCDDDDDDKDDDKKVAGEKRSSRRGGGESGWFGRVFGSGKSKS